MDRVGWHHRPQAAIGKGSCSLRLYQVPERGQQRQGVAHRRRDVAAQAGSHQNRRKQKFASCSELGFRILPRGAGAGRGRAVLETELLLEALAGRLEAQTQRGPLFGRQNHRLWEWGAFGMPWPHALTLSRLESERWGQQDEGAARRRLPGATRRCEARPQAQLMEAGRGTAHTTYRTPRRPQPSPACKLYQRACSERTHPTREWRREGSALSAPSASKPPSAVVKTWRKLVGDSTPPSGQAALIRTKGGLCGRFYNWNGAGHCGALL